MSELTKNEANRRGRNATAAVPMNPLDREEAHDQWIDALTAHLRDELTKGCPCARCGNITQVTCDRCADADAARKPAPAKCEESGLYPGHTIACSTRGHPIPQPAQPSPTTEAPETVLLPEERIWGGAYTPETKYIRADVVEKRVAEAVADRDAALADAAWNKERPPTIDNEVALLDALGAHDDETALSSARRVVAALKTSVDSEAALLEGVRKAEASEQAALARVRELEDAVRAQAGVSVRYLERAETAERELEEAREAHEKTSDELTRTERRLREADAAIERARKTLRGEP